MFGWPRRKKAPILLAEPLSSAGKFIHTLSTSPHTNSVIDAASRAGVDVAAVFERVFDEIAELAEAAAAEADTLRKSAPAGEVQRLAKRAGDAARQAIDARAQDMSPSRGRSRTSLFIFAIGGLALGTALAYLLLPRPPATQAPARQTDPAATPEDRPQPSNGFIGPTVTNGSSAVSGVLASLRRRVREATTEGNRARAAAERSLRREYNQTALKVDADATTIPIGPPGHQDNATDA